MVPSNHEFDLGIGLLEHRQHQIVFDFPTYSSNVPGVQQNIGLGKRVAIGIRCGVWWVRRVCVRVGDHADASFDPLLGFCVHFHGMCGIV